MFAQAAGSGLVAGIGAVAVLAFELVSVIGTTVLFLAARGPGHALVARLGPRIGLTPARLERASGLVERPAGLRLLADTVIDDEVAPA